MQVVAGDPLAVPGQQRIRSSPTSMSIGEIDIDSRIHGKEDLISLWPLGLCQVHKLCRLGPGAPSTCRQSLLTFRAGNLKTDYAVRVTDGDLRSRCRLG